MTGGQVRLDVGRLEVPEVAQEYVDKLAKNLEDLDVSEDPQTLWLSFNSRIWGVPANTSRGHPDDKKRESLRNKRNYRGVQQCETC